MRHRGAVLCFVFGLWPFAFAQRAPINKVQTTGLSNLIRESESLAILKEGGIQRKTEEAKRVYSIRLGYVDQSSLKVDGKSEDYNYLLDSDSPILGASFSLIPLTGLADGGIDFSVSYLTQEGAGATSGEAAQLHMVFLEPSFFLQKEFARYFVPRIGAGFGLSALFQRGFEDENTSTSKGYGFAYGALDVNVSKVAWFKSELDWALSLEHRRAFGRKSGIAVSEIHKTTLGLALRL